MPLIDEILTKYVLDTSSYDAGQRRMIDGAERM